ncbi:MAG: prolyl oligopeptidase family serine peptidase [Aliidongia sp.]
MHRLIGKSPLFAGLVLVIPLILPPAARAETAPPIEAFTRLPNLYDAQLSPDGARLAVLMPVDGKKTLVVLPTSKDSGIKPQVVGSGDWEVPSFFWKTNRELYVQATRTRRRTGTQPYREARMVRFNIETEKVTELQPSENARVLPGYSIVSTMPGDPGHILIDAGSLRTIDLSNESVSIAVKGPGLVSQWFLDSHYVPRAAESVRNHMMTYYTITEDGEFKAFQTAQFVSGPRFFVVGVSDDPTHLIVLSDHEAGFLAAYEYDPAKQSYIRQIASAPNADIDSPIRWDGRVVGFSMPKTLYFDPEAAALQALIDKALPDTLNILAQITPDHHFALVRARDSKRPTALYKLTLGDKKKLDLIGADYPELEGLSLAPVKRVQYTARDGQKIEAILTMPAGQAGPLPFVVLPHGGPTAQDIVQFDYWAQFLASRGYGVLQPNFRGSTGYGAAFQRAGYGQWGGTMQNDVDDGAKWLLDQHMAAPGRVCIVGASYGGYAALYAATSRPDLYRCAAAWAPVTDLDDLIHRLNLFDYKDPNIPTLGKDGAAPAQVSPAERADKAAMPILIGHGEEDYTVPVEHTRTMEAALKKAGKPAEVVYYKDENHYLRLASTRLDFFKRLEAFLGRNIGASATQ